MKKNVFIYLFLILIWSNWSYAACISGDCVNGKGTFTSSNGTKFEGEFKNGEKDGKGTYTYPDGAKYEGEVKNGKRDGKGTYTFPDGRKVFGIWKDDELQR